MKVAVATSERIDRRDTPQIPCPLVQPLASPVPSPTASPATISIGALVFAVAAYMLYRSAGAL
jgi:hypothetical protein